ncbi:tRNA (adenosine(37)-N6)-threonylcarbamoyltransferase complex dimerization subunit type 1 TsaB [Microbacterium sp. G2-8]|uniref:tRNA (adenosine(37)-N6)-threonylcarbamoyltransferase complex dimerization subunit type 1 TsaB n=1 Tax=Microbacterium sp. G2-8 TaxID=2842454 RepID=UPI001C890FA4|nr:tRNA (adenosine(37)-N6)-threonylcarbamoyltransferase complex dimerization subunit type 1 TsaB [Microbacterium sp. G2-8]
MILSVDTSLASSVAVVDPATGDVRAQADSEGTRGHAEVIGALIERALEQSALTPRDITYVAAGMGPGPFTGLRIGIAAARAFAIGRGIPVIPVVSHDAPALERLSAAPGASVEIITDARRREHAVSTYAGLDDAGLPVRVTGPDLRAQGEGETLEARISAGSLGRVAARQLAAERVVDVGEPLYLRAPDVRLPAPRKRVST